MTIDGVVFGGAENVAASAYSLENVETAEDYDEWVATLPFRGKTVNHSDYQLLGETPPGLLSIVTCHLTTPPFQACK
jgi:hypothetical protein